MPKNICIKITTLFQHHQFPLYHIHKNPNKSYTPAQPGTTNLDSSVWQTVIVIRSHTNTEMNYNRNSTHLIFENRLAYISNTNRKLNTTEKKCFLCAIAVFVTKNEKHKSKMQKKNNFQWQFLNSCLWWLRSSLSWWRWGRTVDRSC